MTPDATRRRAIGQILLLAAGFLVLVAISTASVLLVSKAREDGGLVLHTVEVENQINTLLLDIRRAESAARGYLLTRGLSSSRNMARRSRPSSPAIDKLAQLTVGQSDVRSNTSEITGGSGNAARPVQARR